MLHDKLLVACIDQEDAETFFKAKDKLLSPAALPKYQFVRNYFFKHNEFPSLSLVTSKFGALPSPTKDKAEHFLEEVRENYETRVMQDAIKDIAKNPAKAQQLMEKALTDIRSDDEDRVLQYGVAASSRMKRYLDNKAAGGIKYIPTGLDELDEKSYGYNKADFWVVGGTEGIGKSWLLLRFAMWADQYITEENWDRPVLVVSGEMDNEEMSDRLDCLRFGLPYGRFLAGELDKAQELKYMRGLRKLESNMIVVDDCSSIHDLAAYMSMLHPSCVFLDGAHLLAKEYDWKEIYSLTMGIKKLTRRKKIPVFATTHLKSGKGTSRGGGSLDDFSYGKSFTRDADVAGMMFQSEDMALSGELGLHFLKIRRGTPFKIIFKNDFGDMSMKVQSVEDGVFTTMPLSLGDESDDNPLY